MNANDFTLLRNYTQNIFQPCLSVKRALSEQTVLMNLRGFPIKKCHNRKHKALGQDPKDQQSMFLISFCPFFKGCVLFCSHTT